MLYLVAVFFPPVYFFMKKRVVAGVVTSALALLSCIFYIMVVMAPLGLILWAISSVVAVWDLRKRLMREHAQMIAEEIAKKGRQEQLPPVLKS
jgi:hypothetical protein